MSKHPRPSGPRWAALMSLVCVGVCSQPVQADQVELRDGRRLNGAVQEDPNHPESWIIWSERRAEPEVIPRVEVTKITPAEHPLHEYLNRLTTTDSSAESQAELAQYCEQHRLLALARKHYELTLQADPNYAPARKRLGQVWVDGQWLTEEQWKRAQGLVRQGTRWVTPERKARAELQKIRTREQKLRENQVLASVRMWQAGSVEGQAEASRRLRSLDDVAAVPALLKAATSVADPDLRRTVIEAMVGIDDPLASEALIQIYLLGPESWDLAAILETVRRRPLDEVIPQLTRTLDSTNQEIVDRSATALARVGATSAVPKLVTKLITMKKEVRLVARYEPAPAYNFGFTRGGISNQGEGDEGSAEGATSGSTSTGTVRNRSRPAPGLTQIQGFVANSIPVTSPGAVAFQPIIGNTMTGVTNNPGQIRYYQQVVTVPTPDPIVLAALVSLTGVDQGFNLAAWRNWLRQKYEPRGQRLRVVPQP